MHAATILFMFAIIIQMDCYKITPEHKRMKSICEAGWYQVVINEQCCPCTKCPPYDYEIRRVQICLNDKEAKGGCIANDNATECESYNKDSNVITPTTPRIPDVVTVQTELTTILSKTEATVPLFHAIHFVVLVVVLALIIIVISAIVVFMHCSDQRDVLLQKFCSHYTEERNDRDSNCRIRPPECRIENTVNEYDRANSERKIENLHEQQVAPVACGQPVLSTSTYNQKTREMHHCTIINGNVDNLTINQSPGVPPTCPGHHGSGELPSVGHFCSADFPSENSTLLSKRTDVGRKKTNEDCRNRLPQKPERFTNRTDSSCLVHDFNSQVEHIPGTSSVDDLSWETQAKTHNDSNENLGPPRFSSMTHHHDVTNNHQTFNSNEEEGPSTEVDHPSSDQYIDSSQAPDYDRAGRVPCNNFPIDQVRYPPIDSFQY